MSLLRHEQCPKCAELGRDRGKDNLGRYRDGSGFCFSCGYKERRTRVPMEGETVARDDMECPRDLSRVFAEENLRWLRKYLNDEEIYRHFRYSPTIERHIFVAGTYWEARSVTKKPKTLIHGKKPFILFGNVNPIVIVEDVVSAIKIGRVATGLPLFGSHMPSDWIVRLVRRLPEARVWLDPDKVLEARKLAKKIGVLLPGTRTVETEMDPKDYSTEQIKELLS